MQTPESDTRSEWRKQRDEEIAAAVEADANVPIAGLAAGESFQTLQEVLDEFKGHPQAIWGVVENGLIRPVDSKVRLPEGAEVVIVQT